MDAGSICSREVVTVRPTDDLTTAARLMRERHVGYLVVVEPGAAPEPEGVLTDRDIVISVVAREVDPRSLRVADVMIRSPVVVDEAATVESALQRMRQIGVRRVPVVDSMRRLVGVLSLDDVLDSLAEQLMSIAGSIRNEQRIERSTRR